MLRKISQTLSKLLFPFSLLTAIIVDIFYKFDLQEGTRGYNVALVAYAYFCGYLAIILIKKFIKIKSWLIKLFIYLINLAVLIITILNFELLPATGILSSLFAVTFITLSFFAIFVVLYIACKIRKLLIVSVFIFAILSFVVWYVLNRDESSKNITKIEDFNKVVVQEIQPWQLNSRYQINAVVKFLKVDLNKDGKDELAAITSYDKMTDEVFYYAAFYRYNPATEVWDEFYSDEINILNYGIVKESAPEKIVEYKKAIIEMWFKEFTTLENIGDVTGDGCPEIVFSSLLQGKYFDNNIIVAQAGPSSYHFKIKTFMNTAAKIVAEDGLLIEKYQDKNNDIKDIYQWNSTDLYFKLIESQKTKIPALNPPSQAISGLEDLAS